MNKLTPALGGEIPVHTKLYLAAKKLAGISFLIECQGYAQFTSDNRDEVMWGVGLVLSDIKKEIQDVAEELEEGG